VMAAVAVVMAAVAVVMAAVAVMMAAAVLPACLLDPRPRAPSVVVQGGVVMAGAGVEHLLKVQLLELCYLMLLVWWRMLPLLLIPHCERFLLLGHERAVDWTLFLSIYCCLNTGCTPKCISIVSPTFVSCRGFTHPHDVGLQTA
jgi:hypothetical protein